MQRNDFFNAVYDVVRCIPKGKVTTYGAIAKALGAAGSARMVGYAMNAAHSVLPPVPAHRVVNRLGLLTGRHHFKTPETMQKHLEDEGHVIIHHQIHNFENVFWNPFTEL
jgi:methylated-DNA-protein-cysteine methyltransferase-like protein